MVQRAMVVNFFLSDLDGWGVHTMFWIELYLEKHRENAIVKQMMLCLPKYC